MAPLRLALIGLSKSGSAWAATAHHPYLLSAPSKYTITGLLNSSLASSQKAVQDFSLPASTAAYGSPDDLGREFDRYDVIVCSVRVDKHYPSLMPVLRAMEGGKGRGKMVHCEWPLGRNLQEAKELLVAAEEAGVRTMISLQGRYEPAVLKVKEIVESGRIGKVLSSDFIGAGGLGGGRENSNMKWITTRDLGGNLFTIFFGHTMDFVLHALGGELESYNSLIDTKRPKVEIFDKSLGEVVETVDTKVPDQILVQGHLTTGAILSFHLRGGASFPSGPKLLWRVYGEKGEIQITGPQAVLNVGAPTTLELHDHATGEIENITVEEPFESLSMYARNIGRMYEALANGDDSKIIDWKEATKHHALIDEIYEREKAGQSQKAKYVSAV
ncbi:NAD(P)-binding protein [Aulographum hederae CBS 113979]|uniref:NAD(P)-binding protein n=1 Tax=Aulographum hederae CBS 113979 TaxID=1176131 RepID=A0A6G1H9N5_9PEZI|nr:NAD(P)-binding protein [Aulographum hederae CBS 113979]